MQQKYIMTASGKDRPGIVADVSGIIFENGCNLEDSRMGLLADEFSLILLLSGQGEKLEENLQRDIRRLEREKGISVFIRPLDYHLSEYRKNGSVHTIRVEGMDQGGIVHTISKFLAQNSININTLTTRARLTPESGSILYTMKIRAAFPKGVDADVIAEGLDRIGNELNVDIELS